MFQFTHPGRGATKEAIRSLGVRSVSIHAPREGCDGVLLFLRATLRFQFTHPGRGATDAYRELQERLKFQFTHPGRGATRGRSRLACNTGGFNSRTPGGVRLILTSSVSQSAVFQFTHPGRGATHQSYRCGYNHAVSIHAPREGCDSQTLVCPPAGQGFNSRTPGGVRHTFAHHRTTRAWFQFTHPGRGATSTTRTIRQSRLMFQFTHPGRGATVIVQDLSKGQPVSIHAPREGCDLVAPGIRLSRAKFQFTHPGRGATIPRPSACIVAQVSIHAPREGCD